MRSLILFISCTISFLASAQEYSQFHYSTENGLADNRVLSIEQDSRGFMWFGLADGLSRFDGSVFKNYRNTNDSSSLPLHWIDNLYETTPGYLVLTTAGGKLLTLNTYTGQFHRPSDFNNRPICGISKISSSRYLLTYVDTCFIADQNMNQIDAIIPDLQNKSGVVVGQALDENLCLISLRNDPTEYYLYHCNARSLHRLDLGLTIRDADNLQFNFYDSANQWLYFINYFSGVYRYSLDGTRLKHWPMYGYGWSRPFNDSTLVIGALGLGAVLMDLNRDVTTPFRINNEVNYNANFLFADREGDYWIGTYKGVTRLNVNREIIKSWNAFEGQPNGVPFPLRILRGKDQRMYLTFYTLPYLYQLDSRNEKWKLLSKNLITGPWCVNPIGDDIIFTGGGTTRFTTFSPLTGKFQHSSDFLKPYFPNSDVLILSFQHSNGDRWYSANKGGGFVRVTRDGAIHHYTKDGPRGRFSWSYYTSYAEDDSGDLWFGVNKSGLLLHWDYQNDRFSEVLLDTIPGIKGKVYDVINEVIRDKKNNIWIAFDGGGVVRYDHIRNRATRFTDEDGLASRHVSSMIFDSKGRLWMTTYTKGISCLLADENKVRTFTKEEGLTENEFPERCMFYDSVENNLWVGGASSVMRFNPDTLLAQGKENIPVYLDEIYINGKHYAHNPYDQLELTYQNNNLQFRFAAITMDRQSIQLSYKLEGYDTTWTNSLSGKVASYANLPPGDYAFTVRANFIGDMKQASFSKPFIFHIATPWFKTWWFILAVVTSVTLFIAALIRFYYSRKTENQRLILERQQAVEKERTRIATDMHDDFGANLSRIKFISEKIKLKSENESQLSNDLTKISDYSDEMAEKMNEIVWALNERYDSLDDLVSFSRAYAAEYLAQHEIQFRFVTHVTSYKKLPGEVRRNLFLVIKEALHNIVKHAQASRVEITFEQKEYLHVIVTDNGKGFTAGEVRPFANGISNMRKRIQDIGGQLTIRNEDGTTIVMHVAI